MATHALQAIVEAPGWVLLLLKATAVLLVAWTVHGALGRSNPRWRVLLWRVTAVGLLALPAVGWWLPVLEITVESPREARTTMASPTVAVPERPGFPQFAPSPGTMHHAAAQHTSSDREPQFVASSASGHSLFSWRPIVLALWLGGMAVLAFGWLIGRYRIGQIVRRAQPPQPWVRSECLRVARGVGYQKPIDVRQTALVESPLVCRPRRPILLLPPRMCSDSYREDLPAIFAHELTHVRGRDLLWNAGLHLVSIVLWFHPFVWFLRQAHLAACELVCDGVSASFVGSVNAYSRTLARVAVESAALPFPAGIAMARTANVLQRLDALKRRGIQMPLRYRSAVSFGLAALVVIVAVGGTQFAIPLSLAAGENRAGMTAGAVAATSEVPVPSDSRSIQVRVVDSDGKPLSDVTITVRGMTHLPLGPTRYRTDREGNARVELPSDDLTDLQLLVWDNTHVTVGAAWRGGAVAVQPPENYSFTMEPGTTLGGIIRDDEGNPVAGAKVNLEGRKATPGDPRWVCINDNATSDAQGKWQVHRIPQDLSGFDLEMKVTRLDPGSVERFPMKTLSLDQLRTETAETTLHKGIVLQGTVTDPQGNPAVGAAVGLFPGNQLSDYPRTKTDQNGHYRFAVFEPGDYTVAAAAAGLAPDSYAVKLDREPLDVDLQLSKGEMIRLQVVDQTGKPIPEAAVNMVFNNTCFLALQLDYASALERDHDRHMQTDADGRWSRLWLPKDELTFIISKPGYAAATEKALPGDREHVVVLQAAVPNGTGRGTARGACGVTGQVVDHDTKAPITNFRVTEGLTGAGHGDVILWYQSSPVVKADGTYRATWDQFDQRRVVRIEADGYFASEPQPIKERGKLVTFNVALRKGPDVAGVVRSSDGKPLAGAEVVLCTAGRGLYLRNGRPALDQHPLLVRTGADGRFAFPPETDRFLLMAFHDQGVGQVGDQTSTNDIVLTPWARVEGTLLIDGKPAARETVKIDYDDLWDRHPNTLSLDEQPARRIFHDYQTQTDEHGHFVFERVRPGKAKLCHFVKISQEGMLSSWKTASSESVEFTPGQTLSTDLVGGDAAALR